jgi:C-methyltransferase
MTEQPHEIVWTLSTAGFAARCLHLVADLGVADRIGDSPVPVTDLADSCAVKADALDRVLRLLAAHGVFEKQDGGYGHTLSSRLLRTDHPGLCGRSPR